MATRAQLRGWLLEDYRAEVDLDGRPAVRCARCQKILDLDTMTIDRIIPGAYGGRYIRSNTQPACKPCNSVMGTKAPRTMKAFGRVRPGLRAKGAR